MISRRAVTTAALAAVTTAVLPRLTPAAPLPGEGWRRFQVTTRIDLADTAGEAQAWLPLASFHQADWIRTEGDGWSASPNAPWRASMRTARASFTSNGRVAPASPK